MIRNYLKIAWRSLTRNKIYSLINITGLTVGITCCILITLYVKDELSYDNYNPHYNEVYRVLHAYRKTDNFKALPPPAPEEYQVWGNAPTAPALKTDFPEIQKVTQFTSQVTVLLQYGDKSFQESKLAFADSSMFDVFGWKLLYGDRETALKAVNGIVLNKATAEKYFGHINPVGKILKGDADISFTVTGVMDIPANSHLSFDGLISMTFFRQIRSEIFDEWGYIDFYTYLLVSPHTDMNKMAAKVPAYVKHNFKGGPNESYTIAFEPLKNTYLHSVAQRQPGVTGSISNVYIFSLIAVFILFIACINFINLSTARSMERAKEIGVRKAVGAFQEGLMFQYLTEAVLIVLLATVLAVVAVMLLLPAVSDLSGKQLTLAALSSWKIIAMLLLAPVLVGIPAGIYPAWVLARFKPALVLKGKFVSSGKGIQLRKGLVVFQFSLSIALIACTAIVFSQLNHLQSHDLGFRQDQMLVIDYGGDAEVNKKIETIKKVMSENPAVQAVSASRAVPGEFLPNGTTFIQGSNGEMLSFEPGMYEIDFDFIPAFEIQMAAGRAYSRDFPADTEHSLIINEAAARLYGYSNPADIIGKPFDQWGRKGTIIGVTKDFNYQSLHKKVEPLAMRVAQFYSQNRLSVRLKSTDMHKTIAQLQKTWTSLAPQRPFQYSFLDQSFNQQYQQDLRFGQIFIIFGSLTIFIACLGLFGLATYSTEKRLKEIGIRKVLGASVTNIVGLLSGDFVKLVLIAIVIATPLAWWSMSKWLNDFAYRVDIHWWIFMFAGLAAVAIALLTVGFLALRAATKNPVRSLRSE